MKLKKVLTFIIILAMLVAPSLNGFAADSDDTASVDYDVVTPMPMPTVPVLNQNGLEYAYVEGIITEIKDYGIDGEVVENGKQIVRIEKDENKWDVIIDSNTYYITSGKTNRKAMGINDTIKVFYNIKSPALMIYPPRINAEFIAVDLKDTQSVAIDRFDINFTNSKNDLKLIPSLDTEIIYEDGKEFDGESKDLINRKLVVIYSITTKSIPAQTTPEKVIIMYEKAVAPIYMLTDEEKEMIKQSLAEATLIVNGAEIQSPSAIMSDDGVIMVPVRAVAEAMGLTVEWFADTQTVQVGKSLSFSIGKDAYAYNKMSPVALGTAPVLKDGKTYVPIDFFYGNFEGLHADYHYGANIDIIYEKTE